MSPTKGVTSALVWAASSFAVCSTSAWVRALMATLTPLGGERERRAAAEALGRGGDQRDLVLDPEVHMSSDPCTVLYLTSGRDYLWATDPARAS
jgi:hypothetical protein